MADQVRLDLQVGLDTAYLTNQLRTIGTQLAGQQINLQASFDRQTIASQYRALSRYLSGKKFDVKIESATLEALEKRTANFKKALESIGDVKIDVGIGAVKSLSKRDAATIKRELRNEIIGEDKKIFVPVSIKPAITNRDIRDFKNAVQSKLSGITIKVKADLEGESIRGGAKSQADIDADVARGLKAISEIGAARMAGGGAVTEAARREQLRQSLSGGGFDISQLKAIGSQLGVAGVGRFRNAENLINKIVTDASIEMVKKYLDPQAVMRNVDRGGLQRVLDTFARGVFNMLGMDPASMMAAERQKRLPPAISFPATVPPRNIPIGPSGTGRSLPGAPIPLGLPGTAFSGQKRLLGDLLDPELKEILRGAANTFVDSVRSQLNSAVRTVNVRDLGVSVRGAIAAGEIKQPLMLPGAGGTGGYFGGGRRPGGGFVPEGGFPSEGPIAPQSQLARKLPAGYLELGKLSASLKSADKYLNTARFPLADAVRGIGEEFGYAVQQVLLFGTAYKGLAFLTSLPQQAFNASVALQSFNNQLLAITGSAAAADRASEFVLSTVEKFNVPLDSARSGFARLYASMAPAQIPTSTIEGLFEGISKASATLGLSADQVDRVTYAFSQMASKGKMTAEEVNGQLGDVIPGALSLMSQAAGLSMQDFLAAMEKGQLSGKAMEQIFSNLAIVMDQRFGAGAKGAANTLQGAVNQLNTAMTQLYESFEPVVNAVVATFGPSVFGLIENATLAIRAFGESIKGNNGPMNMLGQNSRYIYDILNQLQEIFKAIGTIVSSLAPTFGLLGQSVMFVAEQISRFINTSIGSFLATWALQTGAVLIAMQLLAKAGIINATVALIDFIRQLITGQINLQRIALAAGTAKFSLMTLGATAVLTGITLLVSHLNSVYEKLLDVQKAAKNSAQAIASMSQTEATVRARQIEGEIELLKKLYNQSKKFGDLPTSATAAEVTAMARAGGTPGVAFTGPLLDQKTGQYGQGTVTPTMIPAAIQKMQDDLGRLRQQAKPIDIQAQIQRVDLSAGDKEKDKAAAKAAREAEKLANQQQQARIEAAKRQNALDDARYEHLMSLSDAAFEHEKSLIDARNQYELSGLNSIQARQLKFQQDLKKIEMDRISAIRKAEQEAAKAVQQSVTTARTAAAAQGGDTGLRMGSTGISSGAHFDIRRLNGGRITEAQARAILAPEVNKALTMTSGYGPRRAPVPGASTFHRGIDLAGPAGTPLKLATGYSLEGGIGYDSGKGYNQKVKGPTGEMFEVLHLQKPSQSFARQKRSQKATGEEEVAMVNVQYKAIERLNQIRQENALSIEKTAVLIKQNIDTIFPVAEIKLETDLLKMRNQLQLQGTPQEVIDYKEKLAKASYEAAEAEKVLMNEYDSTQKELLRYYGEIEKGTKLTEEQKEEISRLEKELEMYGKTLGSMPEKQRQYNTALLESTISQMKQADTLKAQQETLRLVENAVNGVTGSYKNLAKALVRGEGTEALKKFQQDVADQALTMFFDFAMKPMEDFFKDSFTQLLGLPSEEETRKEQLAKLEAQLAELKSIKTDTSQIKDKVMPGGAATSTTGAGAGQGFAFSEASVFDPTSMEMAQLNEGAMSSLKEAANSFNAITSDVTQTFTMSATKLETVSTQATTGAQNLQSGLSKVTQGIGLAVSSVMGIVSGINQMKEGGTSNVLGGIGSILLSVGGAIGGFGKLFGVKGFATGGIATGGFSPLPFKAFATGGTVAGPTLGLVGEGRFNEAIVPLPDGKSIPVQMRGNVPNSREIMSGGSQSQAVSPVLNMKFETTSINGVEYVSREQLEQAMMETRRLAVREGSARGASLAIDKLQQSPSTRRRIGI